MIAEITPGDVADFEHQQTIAAVKLARCIDGSPAWVETPNAPSTTVIFEHVTPTAPSRRTSWKARGNPPVKK